jgi:hypothetical protein
VHKILLGITIICVYTLRHQYQGLPANQPERVFLVRFAAIYGLLGSIDSFWPCGGETKI